VPAPGFALVFLTEDAIDAVSPTSTVTFPTTSVTNSQVYIDPSILATSYGHTGMNDVRGATSSGSNSSGASPRYVVLSGAFALIAAVLGATAVSRRW